MNTSYELAPATQLIAVQCAFCHKPLLKAESVERGTGDDCARKYGVDEAQGEPDFVAASKMFGAELPAPGNAKKSADALIYRVAALREGPAVVRAMRAIRALGFVNAANRIAKRLGAVTVARNGDTLLVKSPKGLTPEAFGRYLAATGRLGRWNAEAKVREVPVGASQALWAALKLGLAAGTLVIGDRNISAV